MSRSQALRGSDRFGASSLSLSPCARHINESEHEHAVFETVCDLATLGDAQASVDLRNLTVTLQLRMPVDTRASWLQDSHIKMSDDAMYKV